MIYNFRLWLANWLFKLGKAVHPDIARLEKELAIATNDIANFRFY